MLENHASLVQLQEILQRKAVQEAEFKYLRDKESDRQLIFVRQWLSAADYEFDHECFVNARSQFPSTCRWILGNDIFKSWYEQHPRASPHLWLSGIPGAGKNPCAK